MGLVTRDNPFDAIAEEYDAWFDTARGSAIFRAELECVRPFVTDAHRPWLEVGVGTGRFAQALGVEEGIDPSVTMLRKASVRGIHVRQGAGESVPCDDHSFGGILMVVVVCFFSEPGKAFAETARVLRPRGRLVVGFIPAYSPWGEEYARKGGEGHPIFSQARFYKSNEIIMLAEEAGFYLEGARSCLFTPPSAPLEDGHCHPGVISGAGFVAMAFSHTDRGGASH